MTLLTARVLDALPRAVFVTDIDGMVIGWNIHAERLYGWRHSEALGRSVFELLALSDRFEFTAPLMAGVLEGKPWVGAVSVRTCAGGVRRMKMFLDRFQGTDRDPEGIVGSADDMAEVQLLERSAIELTDHLLLALSAGELGTWRWETGSGAITWDIATETMFGVAPGQFDGTMEMYLSCVHPEDREAVLASVADAVASASSYTVTHRVVWPDGTVHWVQGRGHAIVDANGDVSGTIGCVGDVTERRTAELHAQARVRSAERYAGLERLQRERLEFLTSLNDITLEARDHRDLMARVARAAVPRLGDWCAVHFLHRPDTIPVTEVAHVDPQKVSWVVGLQSRFPFDPDSAIGVPAVIRTGVTEFIADLDETLLQKVVDASPDIEPQFLREVLDELGISSEISVPLRTKAGVIGVIQFVSAESGRKYDHDDVSLAEAVAGRVAAALHNTWLSDSQREVNAKLQAALLPSHLPRIDGLDTAVVYKAGTGMVGGDFYDLFHVPGDKWAVIIGDVCGSGPDAAAVTGKARHTMRAAAMHGFDHSDVLVWLNDALNASDKGLFCTAAYATLERGEGASWIFTSTSGGHPLPIWQRSDGTGEMVGRYGTTLGVLPTINATVAKDTLGPGDTIVMYTDGISDVRPPFALDDTALLELVRLAADGAHAAAVIAANIVDSVEAVLPMTRRHDDLALLVIHVDDNGTLSATTAPGCPSPP